MDINSKGRILIVEDNENMRETLRIFFSKLGYDVRVADGGDKTFEILADKPSWHLVITDLVMPEMDGITVLKEAKKIDETIQVIVITAFGRTEDAVRAMKLGAYHYLQKPFNMDELEQTALNAIEKCLLLRENISFRKTLTVKYGFESIVAKSQKMMEVIDTCRRVKDLPSSILITGESGTGKELIARALHYSSHRSAMPFGVVDCGAIPENLMESELFGHVRGSFTGAISSHEGILRASDGGTVFFDEIGELPLGLQVKILRVLQERVVKPVGGTQEYPVDLRVIAATSRDIEEEVKKDNFRRELYYRLNVIRIIIPPLRERKEDIAPLLEHFLKRFNTAFGKNILRFSESAISRLESYPFPGNVRELSNLVERMVALEVGEEISTETVEKSFTMGKVFEGAEKISEENLSRVEEVGIDTFLGFTEEKILRKFLDLYGWDRKKVAEKLGITERSLRYRLSKYGLISPSDGDKENPV